MVVVIAALVVACGGKGEAQSVDCEAGREQIDVSEVCTSGPLAVATHLLVEVRTDVVEGCSWVVCAAVIDLGAIRLTIDQEKCMGKTGDGCEDSPARQTLACDVPPLEEGTYALWINGMKSHDIEVSKASALTVCEISP